MTQTTAERPPVTEQPKPAETPVEAYASGFNRLTKGLGAVVAPTALFTSLFYYFGWNDAAWFYRYFGVDSSVLGLPSEAYLSRSVDALFVPLAVGAFAGMFLLWGHSLLRARLTGKSLPRLLLAGMAGIGLLLAMGGFVSILTPTVLSGHLTAAPMSLAAGVLLLAYTDQLRRAPTTETERTAKALQPGPDQSAVAEWVIVFILVALSLFWAATDYSAAVGTWRAHRFALHLQASPDIVIYSQRSLSLSAPGIQETRCHDPHATFAYRYEGLKLILRAGDQYLFLPQAWTPSTGRSILIPRDGTLRLEFFPAGSHHGTSPAC